MQILKSYSCSLIFNLFVLWTQISWEYMIRWTSSMRKVTIKSTWNAQDLKMEIQTSKCLRKSHSYVVSFRTTVDRANDCPVCVVNHSEGQQADKRTGCFYAPRLIVWKLLPIKHNQSYPYNEQILKQLFRLQWLLFRRA